MRNCSRRKIAAFAIGVILAVWTMNSCYVSCSFRRGKEQGLYPDTTDFPNTKWKCEEFEICLWILDYGESTVIGTYQDQGTSYRLIANFSFYAPEMTFTLYTTTSEAESIYRDSSGVAYTHCERQLFGSVQTNYVYREGALVCTVVGSDLAQFRGAQKLTFRQESNYQLTVRERYRCPELNLEMESYEEMDGYYKGTIEINGLKCPVQFFEIGNGNYYAVSIENGFTNQLAENTCSELIRVTLTLQDDGLLAKVTDDFLLTPLLFPEWKTESAIFNFVWS